MRLALAGLSLSLLLIGPTFPCGAAVEVLYLGNEGFLLESGDEKVLIDALFGEGLRGYPAVPEPLRAEIENARGRFRGVDLVLASHFHPDHFDATAVARHLAANPEARFVSTQQAAHQLLAQRVAPERFLGVWPADATAKETLEHGGIEVTLMRLHHGNSTAQNLGLLLDIGGVRVLHMGDTVITAEEIASLELRNADIDVVLAPYWYLDSQHLGEVLPTFDGSVLVAMHFPTADAPQSYFDPHAHLEGVIAACGERHPEAWLALEPGDSRRFGRRVD